MDAGCEYHGYASDITRAWPVSGKFSDPQRELYELVLRVHKKCLRVRKIACLKHSFTYGSLNVKSLINIACSTFLFPALSKGGFTGLSSSRHVATSGRGTY